MMCSHMKLEKVPILKPNENSNGNRIHVFDADGVGV